MENSINVMGTGSEKKLLIKMSLPIIISMLVQALYNIVDSAFVGMLNEDALSAVSMAFPFQSLITALTVGIGVGMSQVVSRNLGEKNEKKASRAAAQGLMLSLVCVVAFLLFGVFFSGSFYSLQNAPERIADYGSDYLFIITVFSLGIFAESAFSRMLITTGHTKSAMVCQITGAAVNIALDPILIFGLCGFPALGVAGAAIATVFAQHVAAVMALIFHLRKNKVILFKFSALKPQAELVKTILGIGSSAAIKQGAAAVVLMVVNSLLLGFTPTATAVYGAFNRMFVLICTPAWAISDILVVLSAYNYGIRSKARLKNLLRYGLIYCVGITLLGSIVLMIFPQFFVSMFTSSENMLTLGTAAFPILAAYLPFQITCTTMLAMLQGLGEGAKALIAGLIERFAFPLVMLFVMAQTGNLNMVWWGFVIAEALGVLVSVIFMKKGWKAKAAQL